MHLEFSSGYLLSFCSIGDDSVCSICQDGLSKFITGSPSLDGAVELPGIWLTNSVNIADQLRLQREQQQCQQKLSLDKMKQGTLLLCKVFIGQAVETTSLAR